MWRSVCFVFCWVHVIFGLVGSSFALDKEIDAAVYRLYDLSAEEIAVVEGVKVK